MSDINELDMFESLIDKLIKQALENEKSARVWDEQFAEMKEANKLLVEENLRLTNEIAELKTKIEVMKINNELHVFKDDF